jgi:hypothetical protein
MKRCWVCAKRIRGEGYKEEIIVEYSVGDEIKEEKVSVELCSRECALVFLIVRHAPFYADLDDLVEHLVRDHGVELEDVERGLDKLAKLSVSRQKKLGKKLVKLMKL